MSEPSADRDPFEVVAESFLARFRAGQRPSIEEYAARHPELADQIRELLPALVMVEQDLTVDRDPARAGRGRPASPSAFKEWRLGDYRILREVGRGGMGVVYEAEQVCLGRRVALKVLPGHVAGDRQALERFRREAKAAARLHHTNIVPVFEVGRDGEVGLLRDAVHPGPGARPDHRGAPAAPRARPGGERPRPRQVRGPGRGRDRRRAPGRRASNPQGRAARPDDRDAPDAAGSRPRGRECPRAGEAAATGLATTERFDPAATSGPRPDAPRRELPPAPTAPSPSPSAVLPGGKHVSEVDTSGRRQPFFRSVAQIGRQAAQGLAYAHARGIVHRDIKPSNLLLDTEGVVWITDFGLAKADDDGLTATGDILGTLRYMAPERFRGEGDARADIYALGLTLYELLTLRPAYDSTDRLRLIERIKNEEPARPRSIDPQIPRDLETIVLKAIDKHPDHRYPTAEAMAEDLRRFLADEPIKARQISTSERYWRWARRNPAIAALGGVLTAVLVLATIGSLLMAARFAKLAEDAGDSATAERGARLEADGARTTAVEASKTAETARAAAQAETYRAMLSEVKALRAGHQPGWRDEALAEPRPAGRHAHAAPRPRRAADRGRGQPRRVRRRRGGPARRLRGTVWSLDFSPDSRALVTATGDGDLAPLGRRRAGDIRGRSSIRREGEARTGHRGRPDIIVRFLPDGGLARTTWGHRVEFLDPSGRPSARPPIDGGHGAGRQAGDRSPGPMAGGRLGRRAHRPPRRRHRRAAADHRGRSRRLRARARTGDWLAHPRPGARGPDPADRRGRPARHAGETSRTISIARPSARTGRPSPVRPGTRPPRSGTWHRPRGRVTLRGHKEKVTDLAFSPDGQLGRDHQPRLHHTDLGRPDRPDPGGPAGPLVHARRRVQPGRPAISPSATATGTTALASTRSGAAASGDGWSATATARMPWPSTPACPGSPRGPTITLHRLGRRIGPSLAALGGPTTRFDGLAYSPDGSLLATGERPPRARSGSGTPRPARRVASSPATRNVPCMPWPSTPRAAGSPRGTTAECPDPLGRGHRADPAAREPWGRRGSGRIAFLDGGRHLARRGTIAAARSSCSTWTGPIRPGGSSCRADAADSWSIARRRRADRGGDSDGVPDPRLSLPDLTSSTASRRGMTARSSRSPSSPTGSCWPRAGTTAGSSSATRRPSSRC